jgi:hypothetical protein
MQRETFSGALSVGQRLHCALYGGKDGTVVAIHGSQSPESVGSLGGGFVQTGGNAYIDVIWDSGARSNKVPECIIRGVQWRIYDDIRSTDEILDAIDNARRFDIRAIATAEGKAARFRAEREEHRANYPHLIAVADGQHSGGQLVAKNIRIELKRLFPGVKFSVKSDYNSVSVSWTDGPADSQVRPIVKRHESGTFDSMTDCAGWDDENTFGQVFGECRFTNYTREFSDDSLELIARDCCKFYSVEFDSMNQYVHGDSLWTIARTIASGYTIPDGHKIVGAIRTSKKSGAISAYDEFFEVVTVAVDPAETEAKKRLAKLPVFTKFRSGHYLADPKYTFSMQRFRKIETATKAADKVRKLGYVVDIVENYKDFTIKLVELPASEEKAADDSKIVSIAEPEILEPIQPTDSEQVDESHLDIFSWL